MAADTFISFPSAKVTSSLGEVSPASITIQYAVNAYPKADVVLYGGVEAANGVNMPTDASTLGSLGSIQALTYTARTSPDTKIHIEDGAGGTLDFEGFISGPSLSLSRNSIVPAFSVVGKSGVMENLKLSVYRTKFDREKGSEEINTAGRGNSIVTEDDANLPRRVIKLLTRMIRIWESYDYGLQSEKSRMSASVKAARHRLNLQGPITSFARLMANSVGTVSFGWMEEMSKAKEFNLGFNQQLLTTLRAPSNGFSENLASFMQHFRLMWITSLDGDVGRLARLDEVVALPQKSIKLSTSSFFQEGQPATGLFPITQVVMTGVTAAIHMLGQEKAAQEIAAGTDFVLGSWPVPAEGASIPDGDVLEVQPPPFLENILQYAVRSTPNRGGVPDFTSFTTSLNQLHKLTQLFADKTVANAVQELCRSMYRDVTIRASTLQVTIPLDVTIKHGERYDVRNAESDLLFSGFLSSVTHTLRREQGGGQATTGLNFTHVLYPGFAIQ